MSTYKALCCSENVYSQSLELYFAGDVCTCANECIISTDYNKIQPIVIFNKGQGKKFITKLIESNDLNQMKNGVFHKILNDHHKNINIRSCFTNLKII